MIAPAVTGVGCTVRVGSRKARGAEAASGPSADAAPARDVTNNSARRAASAKNVSSAPSIVILPDSCQAISFCYNPAILHQTGRSAVRIARTVRVREVGGSSPPAPTFQTSYRTDSILHDPCGVG